MNTALTGMDCQALASAVMAWLGQALLFGTLLAIITWLVIRLLSRRIPPAVEALLWTIVLVKFLVPIGPSWSFSMGNVYNSLPVPVEVQAMPLAANSEAWPLPTTLPAAGTKQVHWSALAGVCYLLCAAGLISRRTWCHQSFLTWCRSLPRAEATAQIIASNVCKNLGMHRTPSVRISRDVPVSFVTGLFRPVIVLSKNQLVRPNELESVILHEVAHLRRGDMFVRYLQWIAGSLLFFWPVVAWVNRRIDAARELACDEWALSRGRLAAGEYARCVLHAMQPRRPGRLACHSTSLAANHKNMERRIDMILEFSSRSTKQRQLGLFTITALLLWSCFALTGASDASIKSDWPVTEEAVKEHAVLIYNLVAGIGAADMNGDGALTYTEKATYLVALGMNMPKAFMEEFPYADRNQSGKLDCLEVYGVIRGITLIAYADRRASAGQIGDDLDLEFCHKALDAQQWLLDHRKSEPTASALDNTWSVIKRVEGSPKVYHHRMLDHGGPEPLTRPKNLDESKRFQELEGNIQTLKAKLREESDPRKARKLETMLSKLEALLTRLKTT